MLKKVLRIRNIVSQGTGQETYRWAVLEAGQPVDTLAGKRSLEQSDRECNKNLG